MILRDEIKKKTKLWINKSELCDEKPKDKKVEIMN